MDINEEQTAFYSLLGQCIAAWSHVEDALYTNFWVAISQDRKGNYPAQAAFYAIQSPEGKIEMANSAVTFRLLMGMGEPKDDPRRRLLTLWQQLIKTTNQRRRRRNQLAHFQVLTTLNHKPGKRLELRPALFNPNAILSRRRSWHCAELEVTRRTFGKISFDLDVFAEALAKLLGQLEGRPIREDRLAQLFLQLGDRSYEGPGLLPESSRA